jgi:cell division protein FtsB
MLRRVLVGLTFVLVGAGVYLALSDNGLLHVHRLKVEKAKLEHQLIRLQQEKAETEARTKQLLTEPSAVEREIREQLKYVREDETVFIVPETTPTGAP